MKKSSTEESSKIGFFDFKEIIHEYLTNREIQKTIRAALSSSPSGRESRADRKKHKNEFESIAHRQKILLKQLLLRVGIIALAGIAGEEIILNATHTNDELSAPLSPEAPIQESQSIVSVPPDIGIKQFTKIQPFKPQSEIAIENLIELQNYWKQTSLDALRYFQAADPKITELIQYIENKAFFSIPVGPILTQNIGSLDDMNRVTALMEDPQGFEIVFMPEEFAATMPSAILTEPSGHTIRIATEFQCLQWLGIMLAHELGHVRDQLLHGEQSNIKDEYYAGEVRSHLFESQLLKFWNPKTYQFLIEKGAGLYRQAYDTGQTDQLFEFIDKMFPTAAGLVSRHESTLGRASCLTAIAFEEALKNGASEKDLRLVYQDVGKRFMKFVR